jgi:DNA-binding NarL/FixJ family response regulator
MRPAHVPAPHGSAPGEQPIRVMLADRHPAMRRSLRLLLDSEYDLQVVAEIGELADLVRQIPTHDPDALVIEMGFPCAGSLHAIRRLRGISPRLSIIATGLHEAAAFGRAAIQAGADGYVLQEQADTQLPDAIRAASRPPGVRVASA